MSSEHKVVKLALDKDTMEADLEAIIDEGDAAGWTLVSITPIISGEKSTDGSGGYGGWGWGYGYTSHLLVTFKK